MCVYVRTCLPVFVWYVCVRLCPCVHVSPRVRVIRVCPYVCVHMCSCVHMYVCVSTCPRVCVCVCSGGPEIYVDVTGSTTTFLLEEDTTTGPRDRREGRDRGLESRIGTSGSSPWRSRPKIHRMRENGSGWSRRYYHLYFILGGTKSTFLVPPRHSMRKGRRGSSLLLEVGGRIPRVEGPGTETRGPRDLRLDREDLELVSGSAIAPSVRRVVTRGKRPQ